jgi:DNA ligase-4
MQPVTTLTLPAARQGQRRLHKVEQLREGRQGRRGARRRLRQGGGGCNAAALRESTAGISGGSGRAAHTYDAASSPSLRFLTLAAGLAKAGSQKEQREVAQWFVSNATAQEMKWIVRLVLKKLQIGCSDSTILKHFHVDADALHNSCMSIRRVADELWDAQVRLHVRAVNFGQPMKPMLADKVQLSTLQQNIRDKEIIIESKLDGERLLLHYDQKAASLFLFSRQGTDYSDMYGKQLKPLLKQHCRCSSCVLDGEILAWNEADQVFEDFGTLKTVAAGDGKHRHVCFVAFDVLMLNGTVVTDQTLRQRRQLLESCVQPLDNWFYCVAQHVCDSVETVREKLQEACERQEEGIVLKDLNSKYLPGERSSAWCKLKLDCLDNMSHDLDLIVIGASYSKSRGRHGALYDLLLGVRVEQATSECIAMSFCRVGSGLSFKGSDEQSFVALAKRLEPHWKNFDPSNPPAMLQLRGGAKERPDKWIDPHDSVVLEVASL